jgi:hypothetical protein
MKKDCTLQSNSTNSVIHYSFFPCLSAHILNCTHRLIFKSSQTIQNIFVPNIFVPKYLCPKPSATVTPDMIVTRRACFPTTYLIKIRCFANEFSNSLIKCRFNQSLLLAFDQDLLNDVIRHQIAELQTYTAWIVAHLGKRQQF